MNTIGFIGAGNMGSAILRGIAGSDMKLEAELFAYNPTEAKVDALADCGVQKCKSAAEVVEKSRYVFLAIKPQKFEEVLPQIADAVTEQTVLVSIAAGIGAEFIRKLTKPFAKVVLAMPNTPLLLGEGATALAKSEDCDGPDLIYLPEVDFDMEQFLADVHRIYEEKNNVLIAVSEGIHYADGSFVSEAKASATDGFGHAQLGGLAARLAQVIKEREHTKVRGIELSLLQRAGAHLASQTDIDEAFAAGKMAVEAALSGETGKMVAFERVMVNGQYTCRMKLIPLSDVANYEKKVPVEWIVPEGNNVTQDFIDYALPLIQGVPEIPLENGLPRYARLKKVLVE